MPGMVANMVLRCDDCIKYHPGKCNDPRITTEGVYVVFSVVNIAGETIVIPHTGQAAEYWEALRNQRTFQVPKNCEVLT
jgi:hypothetical protein